MTNEHPIDLLIASLIASFDGICWLINELAGFHAPLTAETVEPVLVDPRDVYAIEAPVQIQEPTIEDMPDWDMYVDFCFKRDDLAKMSVNALRRRARGMAKGTHQMRKAELVALLQS
jgi:hypothetical protein